MAGSESYAVYDLTVPAGAELPIGAVGSYVSVLSSNLAEFRLGIDDDLPQFIAAGLTVLTREGESFRKISVDNSAGGAALVVRLAIGSGELRDARLALTGAVPLTKSANLASLNDVALTAGVATLIASVNAARREVLVSNLAGNAQIIRLGNANVAAAQGIELAPGGTAVIATGARVFGFSAVAQSVGVVEVLD